MEYKIRKAVPSDEKRIRELFTEMLRTINRTDDAQEYEDGYLDHYWSSDENLIYVTEVRDVSAFLSVEVHREAREYLYLDDFSVTEACRNKGIGTALIEAAEAYAKKLGIPAVLLHVEKGNKPASRLYRRLGYSIYREEQSRYLMKKEL